MKRSISFKYFMDLQVRFIQFKAHLLHTNNFALVAVEYAPILRSKIQKKYNLENYIIKIERS